MKVNPKKKHGMYVHPAEPDRAHDQYFPKIKIITDSEDSKEQLLKALEYIHNLNCVNSDYIAVNSLMHYYLFPGSIEVKPDYDFDPGPQR